MKRSRNIFDPVLNSIGGGEPFKISRSKIENFLRCPRCFYLDRRMGIAEPPGYPFNLNSAVDHLLKKEFDAHRAKGEAHPLMKQYGIDAVPFAHPDLDQWRENFVGVRYRHGPSNFLVTGAVDDIWAGRNVQKLHVVDYKATSKDGDVTLDAEWQKGYKNQMEIYQWLLRKNGHLVSDTGYFVYVNGRRDRAAFDAKLEFDVKIIPYTGNDAWVEGALMRARACLDSDTFPESGEGCAYCEYRKSAREIEP